jgi:hypothetical protein
MIGLYGYMVIEPPVMIAFHGFLKKWSLASNVLVNGFGLACIIRHSSRFVDIKRRWWLMMNWHFRWWLKSDLTQRQPMRIFVNAEIVELKWWSRLLLSLKLLRKRTWACWEWTKKLFFFFFSNDGDPWHLSMFFGHPFSMAIDYTCYLLFSCCNNNNN